MFQHEREDAKQHNRDIITAKVVPGTFDSLEWLKVPVLILWLGMVLSLAFLLVALYDQETAASGCRLCMFFMKTLENTSKLKDQIQSKRLTRKSRMRNYNFDKRLILL